MAQTQILMVDNSNATSKIISRLIEKKLPNCFVSTCKTASQAIELASEKKFNLITSSLRLPDLDGLSLAIKIRNNKTYTKTPFIIVSGDIDAALMKKGFESGVTGYFDKIDGHSALISYIESLLPKKESFAAKILYVEDSKTAAFRANRILDTHGYKIIHTDNAEQAFDLMSLSSAPKDPMFDLIVTDINLKGKMNGYELVQNIRGRLHFTPFDLPVIISSTEEPNIDLIMDCGANDFITKPIHEDLFCIRLQGLLAVRDQHRYQQIENIVKELA